MVSRRKELEDALHEVAPHDHAVFTYDNDEELSGALQAFIESGVEQKHLIVFVHAFGSDEEAWAFVRRAHSVGPEELADHVVVVSLYEAAFEGGARKIDYEHVARILQGLIERSARTGKVGTRIFVDASRAYFAGARAKEWFEFESWLGVRLQHEVGLVCAYPRADIMKKDVLPQVLRTHAYRFDARGKTLS